MQTFDPDFARPSLARLRRLTAALLVAACAVTGVLCGACAPNSQGISGGVELGEPLKPSTQFEKSKDVPIAADTHFAAGQVAETQNNTELAVEQYRKALSLARHHRKALFRLGVVYAKRKEYDAAVETWQRYVRVTSGDATALANLGFCYELAGRGDEAEVAYLRGIRREPRNGPCRVNYGLLLARRGQFSEATLQLQTVLGPAEVHYNLASAYEWMGRTEQAKLEYRKALELDPKMADAQARLEAME